MTEPTDAELDSIDMDAKAIANQNPIGTPFAWRKAYLAALAHSVLAKWGTPPAVGMELAAFLVCTEEGDPDMVFLDRHEAQQYLEDDEQPIPLYRHSQPTQPKE